MNGLLKRLASHWATRSITAGAVSTVVDVLALAVLLKLLHLAVAPASALAVAAGGAVSFLLNKYVAFRDRVRPVLPQALRYAAALAVAMAAHALLMHLLVDRLRAPWLGAKLLADLAVFGCGSLLTLRYLVFGKPAS